MQKIIQKGYSLRQNHDFPSRSSRLYTFTCTTTGKAYDFGSCHSECVRAFENASLREMIEHYPELAEVDNG